MKKLILIIVLLASMNLYSQEIPHFISYQGKILEGDVPVNGTKNMTFNIGSWSKDTVVEVIDGIYSIALGPIPLEIFENSTDLSLEIVVEGIELDPETIILSVPFSYKSEKSVDTKKINGNPVEGDPILDQVLKWNGIEWAPQNDALSLPFSDLSYDGGDDAFLIHNIGTSGAVAEFEIDNASSAGWPLVLQTNGQGEALLMYNDGSNHAIRINNGDSGNGGCGIYLDNDGNSDGIYINNSEYSQYGIWLRNYSSNQALYIEQHGQQEPCASFMLQNSNSSQNTLEVTTTGSGDAIYAKAFGTGLAAYFDGDIVVSGTINKGAVGFKIDHPIFPESKFLLHSCVESPDMMNIYNGNSVCDVDGKVIVQLPDWFEALNMEYRYQLTCIGSFAQVYIAEELKDNRFTIAGGAPGLKVSWQVTGIRQDPYAKANRIKVEVDKNEKERGHYLHYKEYGQPFENSIEILMNPSIQGDK